MKMLGKSPIYAVATLLCLVACHDGGGGHALLMQQQQTAEQQPSAQQTSDNNNTTTLNVPQPPPPPSQATPVARIPAPRVRLNKCCEFGEYLDAATLQCIAGNTDLWVPKIFLAQKKEWFKQAGRSPPFMTFRPNVRPTKEAADEPEDSCSAEELELFTGAGNLVLWSNGSLYLREHEVFIAPQRYCVDREAALVCRPKQMQSSLRIRKCCGKYSNYDGHAHTCTMAATNKLGKLQLGSSIDDSEYQPIYGFPACRGSSSTYAIAGDWSNAVLNHSTGTLQVDRKNFSSSEYCLEHLRDGNGAAATVKIFACLHHYSDEGSGESSNGSGATKASIAGGGGGGFLTPLTQKAVLKVAILVSVFFLGATLVASYLTPSVHHVLHWRCQVYYVFCLFVGKAMLAYTLFGMDSTDWGSFACLSLASLQHFFFLAAFFWLNTMCVNIWWTFRDFRPSSLERNQELLRLRLYFAYAWGIPLVFCFLAVLMDHLDQDVLKPNFGQRNCWFNGEDMAIFAYFYAPMAVLLCFNIVLFISTTHQLTCGLWKRDDVKSSSEKSALGKVCLKLVVVMGVTWILDILSWLVGDTYAVWFVSDLINALQGVFIFIVVGCQPQVWAACKRFCCPRSRQEITNTTNGVQHSSSSQGLPSLAACGPELTQNTSINTTIGGGGGGLSGGKGGVGEAANTTIGSTTTTAAKVPMETVC